MSSSVIEEANSRVPGSDVSKIVEFYKGTNVLITGGTGFIGMLVIEKLMRSCPDVAKIYMMIRPKKGKSMEERFKKCFDDVLYSRVKQEQPDCLSKIVLIEGDAGDENFGLAPETRQMLNNTNIVIHCAACVKFNEKIRVIVQTNVRTTKQLLLWARSLPNLKAFVYVSTAFSNCVHDTIDEIHYEPPLDCDKAIALVECLNDDQLLEIGRTLRGKWPNNYSFSKATAENAVLKYAGDDPVGIVRPSMVTSTYYEPHPGWTNNFNGPLGMAAAESVGIVHVMHCMREVVADLIPADAVVANIIAAAYDIHERNASAKREERTDMPDEERVPVYNHVTSTGNQLTWGRLMDLARFTANKYPSAKKIWHNWVILNRYIIVCNISHVVFHLVPGVIVDSVTRLLGHKPMLMDLYRKLRSYSEVVCFFTTHGWHFRDENVRKMWSKLGPKDREIFNFDVSHVDWDDYIHIGQRGVREYLLKDPVTEESLRAGRSKFWKLRIANHIVLPLYVLAWLWLIYTLVSTVLSYCLLVILYVVSLI